MLFCEVTLNVRRERKLEGFEKARAGGTHTRHATTTELSVDREIAKALFAAGIATFQAPAKHERGQSECDAVRLRTSQRLSVYTWAS